MIKIAFIGEAGTGKDTIAEYFCEKYDGLSYAFATHVYKVAKEYYPQLFTNGKPRKLLTDIGDFFRTVNPDVWIDAMFRDINRAKQTRKAYQHMFPTLGINFAVTDCRYPNEYKRLKEEGYTFIRIVVSEETKKARIEARGDNYKPEDLNHSSEQYFDTFEYDHVIDNNGDIEDAFKQLDKILLG